MKESQKASRPNQQTGVPNHSLKKEGQFRREGKVKGHDRRINISVDGKNSKMTYVSGS